MGNFFTKIVKPDIVNGDISNIQAANKSHVDIDAGDVIFDWTEVQMPKGGALLTGVSAIIVAEDGAYGSGSISDYQLIFAKSVNGEAPSSLGTVGGAATGGFDLMNHYVGGLVLASSAGSYSLDLLRFLVAYSSGASTRFHTQTSIQLEPSHNNEPYEKLYVAGIQHDARGYQTGVIVNGAITSDTETVITVDGINAHKIFEPGDTVYLHDVDTALGTVKSINSDGTAITLNAAIAGGTDLADDDELVNANPIKLLLHFEKGF
jgi:hypothetical protein